MEFADDFKKCLEKFGNIQLWIVSTYESFTVER